VYICEASVKVIFGVSLAAFGLNKSFPVSLLQAHLLHQEKVEPAVPLAKLAALPAAHELWGGAKGGSDCLRLAAKINCPIVRRTWMPVKRMGLGISVS
jgi:hypothetical protein